MKESRSALRVLDYLFREGPANRIEVARATELSRQTVSKLVGELQAHGLVAQRRAPAAESGRYGRPPALLELNPLIGAVGAVDFAHSSVRVAIADLAGTVIAETRYELDVDHEAERSIALAVAGLNELIAEHGIPRHRVIGVGAAISAPVRTRRGASPRPEFSRAGARYLPSASSSGGSG